MRGLFTTFDAVCSFQSANYPSPQYLLYSVLVYTLSFQTYTNIVLIIVKLSDKDQRIWPHFMSEALQVRISERIYMFTLNRLIHLLERLIRSLALWSSLREQPSCTFQAPAEMCSWAVSETRVGAAVLSRDGCYAIEHHYAASTVRLTSPIMHYWPSVAAEHGIPPRGGWGSTGGSP